MTTATPTWERPDRPPRPPRVDPVWRKAPVALAHVPVVLAAVAGAALVLGFAAASGPLFLASAAEATRAAELAALDPAEAGLVVELPVAAAPGAAEALDEALAAEVARTVPELGAPIRTARSAPVTLSAPGGEARVRLVGEAGAAASGFVVPGALAADLGLTGGEAFDLMRAGETVRGSVGQVTDAPVTGEYAEVVGGLERTTAIAAELDATLQVRWGFPLDQAAAGDLEGLAGRIQALRQRVADSGTDIGAVVAEHTEFRTRVDTSSALPAAARRTAEAAAALEPPVRSQWLAALLAALVVVAGAGALRARRRWLEHVVMSARGVTPIAQALRAAVETAPPVLAGAAVGVVAAGGALAVLGPAGLVDAALPAAAWSAAGAAVVALGLVAAATAATLRGGHAARARGVLGRVPWEVAPLGLAALSYAGLRAAEPVASPGTPPLLLAFPVLALLGAVGLVARLLAAALPRLRRVGRHASAPAQLLVRRVAAAPAATVALVAVSGFAVGVLVAAATLAASAAETAEAKAAVALGADAAAAAPSPAAAEPVPDTTVVGRGEGRAEPGAVRVDLLAVDPASLVDVAAWRPAFADRPLDELLAPLRGGADRGVPVLVVGGLAQEPLRLHGPGFVVPVSAAAEARVFPGLGGERPLLVADRDVLAAAVTAAEGRPLPVALGAEVWAAGAPAEAAARAIAAGADREDVRTAAALADTPALRAARWTLGYLEGVAAGAGLLAALAVALVLAERQRSREVAYALARRMGLTRSAHRRGVAGELAALLATAVLLGAALGVAVAALAAPLNDPLPAQPPEPLLAIPWAALATTVAGAAAVVVAGTALVQRAADRTRVAEVLRVES